MRITSFIAAIFISASFLSSSVDNAAMGVAFAQTEPAKFLTYRAINKLQLRHGMKRRTLHKRAPQRGKDNDENTGKSGNTNRNGDDNENRGTDRDADRGGNRAGNRGGNDRGDDRQNNNGKESDAKAKNDEDNERNAKNNNQHPNEEETSGDDAEADENHNDDVDNDTDTAANDTAVDNTTANETVTSGEGDNDSNLYNNGPSSVNTKGVQNGTVIAAVTVGGLVLLGASIIVFMRRRKHDVQTEAIIEKSATAFAQQSSEYETLEDSPPPVGTFNVISNFAPNLSDELEVELGDHITVLVEYDDGWVQGINESRGGTKGVMPRHCLNMNSKYSMNKRSSSIGFTNVTLG